MGYNQVTRTTQSDGGWRHRCYSNGEAANAQFNGLELNTCQAETPDASSSKATLQLNLTALNVDVQSSIMALLTTPDLSRLMRTCRFFQDTALRPLCARSGVSLVDVHLRHVPSFRDFLRIDAGLFSRTSLIKELWMGVAWLSPHFADPCTDRKSTRLNSSHSGESRMPSSA